MSSLSVCFCPSFTKPTPPASLVVFYESHPAVPESKVREYLKYAMDYARVHKVYLVTGRFVLQKRLCLCLISPEGHPLGIQKATHLNLLHHGALEPGDSISVIDTELGRFALAVDVDIFHPEVTRAAALQGAEVVVSSQYFDLYDLSPTRIMSGCWDMAQQNQLPVISINNQSCCVCAPCLATPDGSGFILPITSQVPASASLDPQSIKKSVESVDILQFLNPDFCSRHMPQLDR